MLTYSFCIADVKSILDLPRREAGCGGPSLYYTRHFHLNYPQRTENPSRYQRPGSGTIPCSWYWVSKMF